MALYLTQAKNATDNSMQAMQPFEEIILSSSVWTSEAIQKAPIVKLSDVFSSDYLRSSTNIRTVLQSWAANLVTDKGITVYAVLNTRSAQAEYRGICGGSEFDVVFVQDKDKKAIILRVQISSVGTSSLPSANMKMEYTPSQLWQTVYEQYFLEIHPDVKVRSMLTSMCASCGMHILP